VWVHTLRAKVVSVSERALQGLSKVSKLLVSGDDKIVNLIP
jgi:hypothetical protein